jgi:hypothetical protein
MTNLIIGVHGDVITRGDVRIENGVITAVGES